MRGFTVDGASRAKALADFALKSADILRMTKVRNVRNCNVRDFEGGRESGRCQWKDLWLP